MTENDPSAQDRPTPASGMPEQPNSAASGGAQQGGTPSGGDQPAPPFQYPPHTPSGQYAQGGYPGSPYAQPGYGTAAEPHAATATASSASSAPTTAQRGLPGKLVAGVALLALLVGGGAGAAGGYLAADTATDSPSSNALNQPAPAKQTGGAEQGSVEAVAEKLKPSVVQLQVQGQGSANEGSGFVISEDGYILTNNHVVEAAARGGDMTVVFHNGDEAEAEVVGRDPSTDIAVVRAQDVSGLTTVELGRSDDLNVGQSVVAVGSPFELAGTVTSGIISSLNRPVTAGGQGDQTTVMDAIQTDAAINPGNSGGPLANMQGQIVGINSAIYSPSQGGNVGIGFAIPIDQARRTADEIIKNGHATQTYIGATVGNAPSGGAAIGEVQSGSPAEEAGIESGDVIVKMGERRIEDANSLVAAIRTRAPGEQVTFTLGDGNTVEVTLGGQPVTVN
ncbi:S1C family serine protease [Saccharomonospora piscinae]|uniref:S1C family serine protease n=1 Tax=Saccharomonospora piscinae TaxID=687388 RepID=UPI001ABDE1F0|nr:trypsin-like peptidase domain-containing protein [Saccharomonospora piscinae]